jgi:dipeptidyl aminopeptidase/acylaminoacyl peptidase
MKILIALLVAVTFLILIFMLPLQSNGTQAAVPYAIMQLTNDHAVDVRPAWSPDNRLIAYQSNRDGETFHIYLMNADGSQQRALTRGSTDDRHPVWMPDGKAILFDSLDGTHREIWKVNVADGTLSQITRIGGLANFPSPNPDANRIAFYFFKEDQLDLWTARLDGSDAKPVTRGLASAKNNQCTFACHQAGWSADGRTIAYSAGELDSIWTIASDGSNSKQVVDNGEDNHFPWFLPDGRLGYITEHIEATNKAWTDAWALDLKTGQRTLIQSQMSMQGPLEWSNDGSKVLFHSPRLGNFDIYMIDLAAPGGADALKGMAIPPEQMKSAEAANTPTTSAILNMPSSLIFVGAGVLSLLAVAGVGLALYKSRN